MTFKIHTSAHTLFAARIMVSQLMKLGHQASIVDKIDTADLTMYIIYAAFRHAAMPPNYIVFQTEIAPSHHFAPHYNRILSRARAVWDYSPQNAVHYRAHAPRVAIVTPGVMPIATDIRTKDIDYTFYGWLDGSMRRMELLSAINVKYPVNIYTNLLGEGMFHVLQRSKVVINLHYYDYSPLEVFRINEALSHGCAVLSEGFDPKYAPFVHFSSSKEQIIGTLPKLKPQTYDLTALDNLEEIRIALKSIS